MQQPIAQTTGSLASYDEIQYESHSFQHCHPSLLQGTAQLFGLASCPPETARILEIGCASGGNIIPLAVNYPKSQCVGIDYSKAQIEAGRKDVNALNLRNMKLLHMSVMDVTKELGEFDYIIAHGLFSWVPMEVQDKILQVCKENLSSNGIAYISYNTLPGWGILRGLRDQLLEHTNQFKDHKTKIQQARWLLSRISENAVNSGSTLAPFFQQEAARLATLNDSYIMHEYLEDNNDAMYFRDFVAKASASGLQYLADAAIETMFTGLIPPDVARTLPDRIATEQYVDYIAGRRFRRSLLCHQGKALQSTPTYARDGYFVSNFLYPQGFEKHNIASGATVSIPSASGMTINTSNPLELAVQQTFMELRKEPAKLELIAARVQEKLTRANLKGETGSALENGILGLLLRAIQFGGVIYYSAPLPCVHEVSQKPAVSELVRYQAKTKDWVTNQRHEIVQVAQFEKLMLQEMDGTRTQAALVKQMARHFQNQLLTMNDGTRTITQPAEIEKRLEAIITEKLQLCCMLGLLVK